MSPSTFTLRAKLICAIAVVVSLVSFPLMYLGYRDAYDHAIDAAVEKFGNITHILSEAAELSYLNTQTIVTEKVVIEKDDISAELGAIEKWVNENRLLDMIPTLDFLDETWGTYTAVVNDSGEFLYVSPQIHKLWHTDARDLLGVPFREFFRSSGKSANRDDFTFFRVVVDPFTGETMPYLAGLRRMKGYSAIVLQELDYLEEPFKASAPMLEASLNDTIRTLDIGKSTTIVAVNGEGRRLASRGPSADGRFFAQADGVLKRAAAEGFVSGIHSDRAVAGGGELYAVRYFKALDWYFIARVPLEVVKIPAVESARTLAGWVVAAFLFASLLGIALTTWFLKPLRQVSEAANKLEALDFISDNTADRLRSVSDALPVALTDEVGQVSRAFSSMVAALEKNIADLKASLARQHGIEGELNAAREIQNGMLPENEGGFRAPGFEAAAYIEAAKEVGGDFYDVFALDDGREAIVLGDVSGKGVSAAMLMSVTLTLVRTALVDGLGPAAAVKKVNDRIAARNPSCMFATLWVGILDAKTGRLVYCCGGHCPPLLVRRDAASAENGAAAFEWLRDVSGPLVGALDMAEYVEFERLLAPGERCIVYSDGISEAMNEAHELFGEAGIERVAQGCAEASSAEIVDRLVAAVAAHRGSAPQSDDITLVVFERLARTNQTKEAESAEASANEKEAACSVDV